MKKLLTLIFAIASMIFVVPAAQAKTAVEKDNFSSASTDFAPQRQYRRQRRNQRYNRYYRRARTVYQTRYVRSGYRLYRYIYRVTYLPNGRVRSRLVSRTRVR